MSFFLEGAAAEKPIQFNEYFPLMYRQLYRNIAMRLIVVLALPMFLFPVGCQHLSLRNHTERQARTLTELQYEQVLGNIALFTQNPNALPFFSVAGTGVTSNNFSANPGGGFNWDLINFNGGPPLFFFDKANLTLAGTLTTSEQWNTASVLNPDELLLMRCIYQKVVGHPACDCDCEKHLQAYFAEHPCYLEAMRPGWYGVGRRCDVPKKAVCIGRCGHTYTWVTADGIDPLTRVSLAILDLATVAPPFVLPDSQATSIKQLTDAAKDLEAILKDYPDQNANSDAYKKLKAQLDVTMNALASAYQSKLPEEQTMNSLSPRLQAHLRKAAAVPVLAPVSTPSEFGFRPRKNLFNPIQGTLGPPFLPGR